MKEREKGEMKFLNYSKNLLNNCEYMYVGISKIEIYIYTFV